MVQYICNSRLSGGVNLAHLTITNNNDFPVKLLTKASECRRCPMTPCTDIPYESNKTFIVSTLNPMVLAYTPFENSEVLCKAEVQFDDASIYNWDLNPTVFGTEHVCTVPYLLTQGPSIYTPLIVLMAILLVAALIYFVINLFIKKAKISRSLDLGNEADSLDIRNAPKRSVDTFLGFCLLLHMFFNYNWIHYSFARHTIWNGLAFPDLIYPWFLWASGFGISPSINRMFSMSDNRLSIFIKIAIASGKLILVGVMLSSLHFCWGINKIPFSGPVQQLGVMYLVIATIEIVFCNSIRRENFADCMVPELVSSPFQWITYLTLIIFYASIYVSASAPGCPAMYFGPGGNGAEPCFANCTGGIAGFLDRIIFGDHVYMNYEFSEVYGGQSFNLYGVSSTISGSVAMFAGYMAGKTYCLTSNRAAISLKMFLGSFASIFIASMLCGFSSNDDSALVPLNYSLLSISLMLLATSLANILHLALIWLVDWLKFWDGKPLYYLGKNVLLVYILHTILKPCFPIFWYTCQDQVNHGANVVMSTWAILLFIVFAAYLHEKHISLTL